jgi:hypothetical protein
VFDPGSLFAFASDNNVMCSTLSEPFSHLISNPGSSPSDYINTAVHPSIGGFLSHPGVSNKLKFLWKFHLIDPLSKMHSQELAIASFEIRDAIKNIPPKIKTVSLVNDPPVFTNCALCAAKHWGAWVFPEPHGHLPLHENNIRIFYNGLYNHI